MLEAENLVSGETIALAFSDFAKHFGYFLPLAGILVVKEIRNNAIDVRATGRLNILYVELLSDNTDWGVAAHEPPSLRLRHGEERNLPRVGTPCSPSGC